MGMDGVGNLEAYQFIAQVIGAGVGMFFAACFILGMIAGPDKVKPSTIIPEQIELGYISDSKPTRSGSPSKDSEINLLKQEINKLKLENQLRAKQQSAIRRSNQKYNGSGWDAVDVAGNSGDDWNPPEYYEKTKKSKTKKVQQDSELIQECIAALVALGEKKSTARSTTNKYFINNPNTKTVEQFIGEVYLK